MGESHPRCERFLTNILAQAGEGGREGRAGKAKTASAATSFGYLAKLTTTTVAAAGGGAEGREENGLRVVSDSCGARVSTFPPDHPYSSDELGVCPFLRDGKFS